MDRDILKSKKGKSGSKNSPFRGVVQYWTLDGKLITEIDRLKEMQREYYN